MSDIFDQPDEAATPLTEEEKGDLKLAYITNRDELNSAEQENIARGQEWALGRRRNFLTENGIKSLHRHMFGDVWRWAGRFRSSERNLGINYWEIPMALRVLLDDAEVWIETKAYPHSVRCILRLPAGRLKTWWRWPMGKPFCGSLVAFRACLPARMSEFGSGISPDSPVIASPVCTKNFKGEPCTLDFIKSMVTNLPVTSAADFGDYVEFGLDRRFNLAMHGRGFHLVSTENPTSEHRL